MVCPNCNKALHGTEQFCPNCGTKLLGDTGASNIPVPLQKKVFKKWILFILCILLATIIIGLSFFFKNNLTDDEKWAVTNCQYLLDCAENPDSFVLADIEIFQIYDGDDAQGVETWMFISYNSDTGNRTAGFNVDGYVADLEDNFFAIPSSKRADYIMMAGVSLSYEKYGEEENPSGAHIERSIISVDKISKNLS